MNTINSLVIEGNMVKEAVAKETTRGKKVANFPIAVNRSIKTSSGEFSKEVSFFDVEAWGPIAETCVQEGAKGRGVRVVGRLKQSRWENAEGKHFSKIFIVAEHIEFKSQYNKNSDSSEKEEIPTEEFANENVSEFEEEEMVAF